MQRYWKYLFLLILALYSMNLLHTEYSQTPERERLEQKDKQVLVSYLSLANTTTPSVRAELKSYLQKHSTEKIYNTYISNTLIQEQYTEVVISKQIGISNKQENRLYKVEYRDRNGLQLILATLKGRQSVLSALEKE